MAKISFLNRAESFCKKATFLNVIVMYKKTQKMKLLYLWSNERKNSEKNVNKPKTRAEGKKKTNNLKIKLQKC